MADLPSPLPQIASGQAQKEVLLNALVDAGSQSTLYGRDADNCAGLDWAYFGGRFHSTSIASAVITVTDNATTYVVAARSNGAVSSSTSNTNWNDQTTYARLFLLTSVSGDITDWEDHRTLIAGAAASAVSRDLQLACSDLTTALATGTGKAYFRAPRAMTLTAVRASLFVAQTGSGGGGIFTVDINEAGSTILSTKITIDNGEKTSTTAATPPVISDSAIADDAEITIDIDQIGDGTAKGLVVTFIYT
jgi:hypothetical protein